MGVTALVDAAIWDDGNRTLVSFCYKGCVRRAGVKANVALRLIDARTRQAISGPERLVPEKAF